MGVIHKLRDDIVDFILANKKTSPDISCRKLSAVVLKEFGIIVSKSSISSVLKNANLNSPVGRHGSGDAEEFSPPVKVSAKFKIPEQKKKQIFPAVKEAVPVQRKSPVKIVKPVIKVEAVILNEEKKQKEPSTLNISLISSRVKDGKTLPEMSNLKSRVNDSGRTSEIFLKNAGMIFLKAADWELSGRSVFGKVLKDELGENFGNNYDLLADMLIFPELLDQKDLSGQNIRRETKILASEDANYALDPQTYLAATTAINSIKDCGLKISIEMGILLRGVSRLKLVNMLGESLWVNAKDQIIDQNNVQSEADYVISVEEVVKKTNQNIIRNVHSAVFHFNLSKKLLTESVQFLNSSFGLISDGGLNNIVYYDDVGKEIAKSMCYFNKKRTFSIALWNWKECCPGILDLRVNDGDPCFIETMEKGFYYRTFDAANLSLVPGRSIQGIMIYSDTLPTEEPIVVLLTNAIDDSQAIESVVRDFLFSWPGIDLENSKKNIFSKKQSVGSHLSFIGELSSQAESDQSLAILKKLFSALSWDLFFSGSSKSSVFDDRLMRERFYNLSGSVKDFCGRAIIVSINTPTDYEYIDDLQSAIERFNSRMYYSPQGQRMILRVSLIKAR